MGGEKGHIGSELLMINTIFYTFSTMAQTLAGAIALLGAFVLYRLQSLRSDIEIDSGEIVRGYPAIVHYIHAEHSSEVVIMNDWHRQGEYRKVLEFGMPTITAQPQSDKLCIEMANRERLRRNLDQHDLLLKTFKKSLWLTVGLISSSMVALAAAELIVRSDILCWLVLIGGLLWFGICLGSYIVLIQTAIE